MVHEIGVSSLNDLGHVSLSGALPIAVCRLTRGVG